MKRQIIIILLFTISSCTNKNVMPSINEAILKEDWEMVAKQAENVLKDGKYYNQNQRNIASDWLRVALLKSGNLNNKFFSYKWAPEMSEPLLADELSIAGIFFSVEIAFFPSTSTVVKIIKNSHIKEDNVFWDVFQKYCYYKNKERFFISVKNELNKEYVPSSNLEAFVREVEQKTKTNIPDTIAEVGLVSDVYSIVNMFSIYKQNKELLEYYTLLMLYYKQLETLPSIVERYKALGYKRLPDYVQEALFIYQIGTGQSVFPKELIENGIRSKVLNILQQRQCNVSDYIHTYTWYYCYV